MDSFQGTALIADPSAAAGRAAAYLLERLGFRVVLTDNADEALALIAGTSPDLVLAEARVETRDGRWLTEAIRCLPGGQAACLFHVTAESAAASIHRAIEAGADDYLVKPYDEALLRFKLMQAKMRGRLCREPGGRRTTLRLVQDNDAVAGVSQAQTGARTGDTSWRFRLYGRAV